MALEMSWQRHLHRRKPGPPLGLKNLGNSCYLNSVLQCLTYTPPLANFCLRNQHSSLCGSASECPFCILERRIVRSLSVDIPLDAPSKIHTSLRIFAKHFRCGHQEDAHEFLRHVIDACHNTCLKLLRDRRNPRPGAGADSSSVVKEIFGGALQNEVRCLSCSAVSRKIDEIMDISLDLFQAASLKDALRRFFQPEVLDGSNKYNCNKCNRLSAARKQMFVLQAPSILVIQLKRFESILGMKIDRAISFEEVLMLSTYMCKASQDPQPEYSLFGTIVHSGYSPDSGHYYAYIKDAAGRWYCCNDSYVTVSTPQEVLSEKVYILFFSRTNPRPKPTKTVSSQNGKKSSPVSNGNALSTNDNETVPTKPSPTRLNGSHQSEKDGPLMSKMNKVPLNPGIKFSLKNPGSKRIDANGNGNLKVDDKGSIMKHDDTEDSKGLERAGVSSVLKSSEELRSTGKQKLQTVSNGSCSDGTKSSGFMDCNGKPAILPAGNGVFHCNGTDLQKVGVLGENGIGNAAVGMSNGVVCGQSQSVSRNGCTGSSSDIPAQKRKSSGTEKLEATPMQSNNESRSDAFSVTELSELKEKLAREAISKLHTCGWANDVENFMHATKKLCTQSVGYAPNRHELKKKLIADAKKTFTSQLPEPLKEHLIGLLRSFGQGKESSGNFNVNHIS